MTYKTKYLVEQVVKTYHIDESGDANLQEFVLDHMDKLDMDSWSVNDLLEQFLIWANGPNWDTFLKTAQQGDVPPK